MIWLFVFMGLMISGCAQDEPREVLTLTLEERLIPYLTTTSSPIPNPDGPTKSPKPRSTNIPAPTSTPFVYEVVENDTLTGIAFRNSVPLEDLIAANPGIDPNFLTIGLTLTIPLDGVVASVLPTSTPISIDIRPPVCYPLSDGSLQCMSVVENDQAFAVENITVMISLESPTRHEPITQIGILPLNIIPMGQKAAVSASFASPIQPDYVAHANLLSVIPISPDDQRYMKTELQIDEIVIYPNGQRASITGAIEFPHEQTNASAVWVSAFAYDTQNNIVGIRKWVADDELNLSDRVNFNLEVYSLGLPIDHIDVLTEVRP